MSVYDPLRDQVIYFAAMSNDSWHTGDVDSPTGYFGYVEFHADADQTDYVEQLISDFTRDEGITLTKIDRSALVGVWLATCDSQGNHYVRNCATPGQSPTIEDIRCAQAIYADWENAYSDWSNDEFDPNWRDNA